MPNDNEPIVRNRPISHVIRQRRAQMLIHSHIYYARSSNIVSDHQWQEWANELVQLQHFWRNSIPWHVGPAICDIEPSGYDKSNFFDAAFKDWDGSTGYHLPIWHPWVVGTALHIMRINNQIDQQELPI